MITHLSPKKQHWSLKFLLAGTRVGGCPLLGFYFPFLLGCSLRKHPGLVPAPNHLYVLLINVCKKASWLWPLTHWGWHSAVSCEGSPCFLHGAQKSILLRHYSWILRSKSERACKSLPLLTCPFQMILETTSSDGSSITWKQPGSPTH